VNVLQLPKIKCLDNDDRFLKTLKSICTSIILPYTYIVIHTPPPPQPDSDGIMLVDPIANWIVARKMLDHLYGANMHVEVIKRCAQIPRFLGLRCVLLVLLLLLLLLNQTRARSFIASLLQWLFT
jgi:hypothetical protein